jgi:F0F1-type ATP synthase assembly protein I
MIGRSIVTSAATSYKNRLRGLVHRAAFDDTDGGTVMRPTFSKNTGEALRAAGSLSTVGLAFVLALVIGFWFGTVLDDWLGTKPVLTIVFFFFGLAAGILNVVRTVSRAFPARPAPPPAGSPTSGGRPDERDLDDGEG